MLPRSFYLLPDVVMIARDLLGKKLVSRIGGVLTSGIITETEAYAGTIDQASHAFGGRHTNRTEIMYRIGGTAYVYLCYGIHSLFNVVTNLEGIPHAILIRGIAPVDGIETMLVRTKKKTVGKDFANGPAKVTKALGVQVIHTGLDLTEKNSDPQKPSIWIERTSFPVPPERIVVATRIGVGYAGEDASLPYRFILK